MILLAISSIICAYLIGSVNFAVIFTRLFTKSDVRDYGSGNAGATNALRIGGVWSGVLTFLCDALKGILAALIGKMAFGYVFEQTGAAWSMAIYGAYACGLVCMLGHIFPIFFEFKGGKGVATGAGIFIICYPMASVMGILAFALVVLLTRYVSASSIIGTVTVVTVALLNYDKSALLLPQLILGVSMGLLIIIKHKDNIKRLIGGNENKISFRK